MIITESKSVMENRKKINMEVNENKLRQIKENIYFSQITLFFATYFVLYNLSLAFKIIWKNILKNIHLCKWIKLRNCLEIG